MNNYSGQNQNVPYFNGLAADSQPQEQPSAVQDTNSLDVSGWPNMPNSPVSTPNAVKIAEALPTTSAPDYSSTWAGSQQPGEITWSDLESCPAEENSTELSRLVTDSSESAAELTTKQPLDGSITRRTNDWAETGQQYSADSESACELIAQQPLDNDMSYGTNNCEEQERPDPTGTEKFGSCNKKLEQQIKRGKRIRLE